MAGHKLSYKILGRREAGENDALGLEQVDVEWSHADGPVKDHVLLPDGPPRTHPLMEEPGHKKVECGERAVVKDTITVPRGTKDSIVMQLLEEKRGRLAEALGVEP